MQAQPLHSQTSQATRLLYDTKRQVGRRNFLSGALCPSPDISACGSRCGSTKNRKNELTQKVLKTKKSRQNQWILTGFWSCYPDLNWGPQIVKDIASSPQSGSVDFSNKAVINFNLLFPCAVLVLNGLMDKDFFNQGV